MIIEGDILNKKAFRAKMEYHGDNYDSIAAFLGITTQTVSNKVNGLYSFTQQEITKLKERWNLTNDEVNEIFFYPVS